MCSPVWAAVVAALVQRQTARFANRNTQFMDWRSP
ncbi:hypothetical protein BN381_430071 [Candidatus Microthrix parvicella RN1]|uniref:Uncharacterized protein n=1 Tax=Candidatus Neomicrothrix parvicella RN1 TaxID=1229780 RepID=R4Z1X5_9ACTN|nr:hypothetical protein BN381_430071 [Candidatus Microthrix parvicella RN1]